MTITAGADKPAPSDLDVITSLDDPYAISGAFKRTIRTTKDYLMVSAPWTGKGFVGFLRDLVPSGVKIYFLTRLPEKRDNSFVAIESLLEVADSKGWKVDIRCNTKLHAKFFVVDGKTCIFTTANPTEYGMMYNQRARAWNNLFITLKLVKKEERGAIDYDYGDYVLGEKFLSIEEGLSVCSHLFSDEVATSQVKITGYGEFPLQSRGQSTFVASRHKYGLVKSEYPIRFFEFRVIDNRASSEWNRELLKEGLPYYPNLSDAIIDYLGFDDWNIGSYGTIYVIVPDYRARIDS